MCEEDGIVWSFASVFLFSSDGKVHDFLILKWCREWVNGKVVDYIMYGTRLL